MGPGVCKQAVQRQPTLPQSEVAHSEVCMKCVCLSVSFWVFFFLGGGGHGFPLILAYLETEKERA